MKEAKSSAGEKAGESSVTFHDEILMGAATL